IAASTPIYLQSLATQGLGHGEEAADPRHQLVGIPQVRGRDVRDAVAERLELRAPHLVATPLLRIPMVVALVLDDETRIAEEHVHARDETPVIGDVDVEFGT